MFDAPVQDYVPLLVENRALDELREQGLHRGLDGVEDTAPAPHVDAPSNSSTPTATPPIV